ncbi:uncharacterized protein AB675_11103 [Cyphellophora attinorum]|uniref:PXMP2/4 family protein 3 n=1 Tax=Cyphellophora attinorum TaxID=1664694 RepID=A0A0N1HM89_9EURO|nr:uncharacterized protein AB675_11103 [Phialophora attinorum]KPI35832.1 hypothetical protein AB675_11103 [Phialophora attinorum]
MEIDPAVARALKQALSFCVLSNVFAQGYSSYQEQRLAINPAAFVRFLLFTAIVTPPNYWWQKWLEDSYPTRVPTGPRQEKEPGAKSDDKAFSVTNTIIKFMLDQSIGCWGNTLAFMVLLPLLKGQTLPQITSTLQQDFWGMVMTSYSFWPLVSIVNLVFVPFKYRALVGNTAAFVWGVYIALIAS